MENTIGLQSKSVAFLQEGKLSLINVLQGRANEWRSYITIIFEPTKISLLEVV